MRKIWDDFKEINNVWFVVLSTLMAGLLCYGYQVTHPTIGMDDTAIPTYFIDGLAPKIGRFTLFLINKIFHIAEYTPYFVDVLGVLFFCLTVWCFCVLFRWISNDTIKTIAYVVFATVFVSSPFAEEVFIYYLHNGAGLAFCLTALSVMAVYRSIKDKKWLWLLGACVALTLAIGCYESFALVYIVTVCLVYFLEAFYSDDEKTGAKKFFVNMGLYLVPLISAVILRKVISKLITLALGIELSERSASAMQYWFVNNPIVIMKDLFYQFLLRYVITGKYFYGVKSYVIALVLFAIAFCILAIVKKKVTVFLYGLAILIAPWLLVVIELQITPYRACQALTLFIAFAWMCVVQSTAAALEGALASNQAKKIKVILLYCVKYCVLFGWCVVVFNQGFQLNSYFYYDSLKDHNDEMVCTAVANRLYENYDITKPVVFFGTYSMPKRLVEWSYVPSDTEEYNRLGQTLNSFDRKSFYSYTNEYGYKIYDVGSEDLLNWMLWASLNENETEIYHYFTMLGYDFVVPSGEQMQAASGAVETMKPWPAKEAVLDVGDYIVVCFERD